MNSYDPIDVYEQTTQQQSAKPQSDEEPQVQVYDISHGALVKSKTVKRVTLVVAMFFVVVFGYAGIRIFLSDSMSSNKTASSTNASQPILPNNTSDPVTPDISQSQSLPTSAANPTVVTSPGAPSQSTAQAPASAPAPATQPIQSAPATGSVAYCGVVGMPQGVCTAITSVEKDGVKGNSYVTAPTDALPPGSKTEVDESSWRGIGADSGQVNFTLSILGKTFNGVANFQLVNGVWKIVSYSTV